MTKLKTFFKQSKLTQLEIMWIQILKWGHIVMESNAFKNQIKKKNAYLHVLKKTISKSEGDVNNE